MGHITFWALIRAIMVHLLARDLYSCAPLLESAILRAGSKFVPPDQREEKYLQWYGDLYSLDKPQAYRIWYALGCACDGLLIGLDAATKPKLKPKQELEVEALGPLTEDDLVYLIKSGQLYDDEHANSSSYYDGWCEECGTWHDETYHPYSDHY